jgi:8-oxo-dGTP pyrophosphatase MutT (NUDIX family)
MGVRMSDANPEESAVPKKGLKRHRPTRIQFVALPYRLDGDVGIEVLLVTSRETGRWIIPKGWPIKGFKPAKSATREAYEEAGVRGKAASIDPETSCFRGYCAEARR